MSRRRNTRRLIMISDGDDLRPAMPAFLYVHVADVDQTYRRAVEAGAESLEAPSDQPYGAGGQW